MKTKIFTCAALASLLMAVSAPEAFAADTETAGYGYVTGQQQNAERHTQYDTIAGLASDEERTAYYEAQGIGGEYHSAAHLDAEALAAAGIITQETAAQIAEYAAAKHDGIHSRFGQMAGMTPQQRHEWYAGFADGGISGDFIEGLMDSGILTQEQADAIGAYLSGANG